MAMSLWGSLASPSSDDANASGFMSFKKISLKSKSHFFFFLKNMISGERKEDTTMVKLVALRTKFASVYLKPHM